MARMISMINYTNSLAMFYVTGKQWLCSRNLFSTIFQGTFSGYVCRRVEEEKEVKNTVTWIYRHRNVYVRMDGVIVGGRGTISLPHPALINI